METMVILRYELIIYFRTFLDFFTIFKNWSAFVKPSMVIFTHVEL
jgi:hypothetical protein